MTNIQLNFDENQNLWIGWQDEASGELTISQITIKPAKNCKDCCDVLNIDLDGQWEDCSCDDCGQLTKFFQVEYPGRSGSREIEVELDDDLERELRNVRDAAWMPGEVVFIASDVDDVHDQFDAFIAEAEAEAEA